MYHNPETSKGKETTPLYNKLDPCRSSSIIGSNLKEFEDLLLRERYIRRAGATSTHLSFVDRHHFSHHLKIKTQTNRYSLAQ